MNKNVTLVLSIVLIFAGTLSRLLPHPLNFTPIAAIALFGGTYLNKKYSIVLPMLALLISDYLLGFYSGMIWIYGSFALIGLIGIWLKNNKSVPMIFGGTLLSSILFFAITNFSVWIDGSLYPKTWDGLIACYVAAIPFFRNTIAGDYFFVVVLFGSFELANYFAKKYSVKIQSI